MTLYAQYIAEREGLSIIEKDHGFITFKLVEKECFLSDMFIENDKRQSGLGKSLLKELVDVALRSGCEVITANIFTKDPNATNTLKAAIASGFKLKSSGINVLLIAKDIGGI